MLSCRWCEVVPSPLQLESTGEPLCIDCLFWNDGRLFWISHTALLMPFSLSVLQHMLMCTRADIWLISMNHEFTCVQANSSTFPLQFAIVDMHFATLALPSVSANAILPLHALIHFVSCHRAHYTTSQWEGHLQSALLPWYTRIWKCPLLLLRDISPMCNSVAVLYPLL